MNFKNLLPSNLVGTRWQQFFDAIQWYVYEFKTNKLSILKNKFNPSENLESDKDNLRDLVQRKGYRIVEGDGYTSTLEFFKRRSLNLPTEIQWALSDKAYKYIFKSFWIYNTSYALGLESAENLSQLIPYTNFQTSVVTDDLFLDPENDIIYYYQVVDGITLPVPNPPIQTGLNPAFLDTPEFPYLDYKSLNEITNHFLLSYFFYTVEEKDVFISYASAKSLYETVQQMHRLKEVPHYRPEMIVKLKTDGSVWSKTYYSYDKNPSKTSFLQSKYFTDTFINLAYIQFGSKPYTDLELVTSITEVNELITELVVDDCFNTFNIENYSIDLEYIMLEYGKFIEGNDLISGNLILSFSEIALLNFNREVIMYIKLPTINFYEFMFSSIKLSIQYEE
jgi:hypothetical protein